MFGVESFWSKITLLSKIHLSTFRFNFPLCLLLPEVRTLYYPFSHIGGRVSFHRPSSASRRIDEHKARTRAGDIFSTAVGKIQRHLFFSLPSFRNFFPSLAPSLQVVVIPCSMMMGSLVPTGPRACVGVRNATAARSAALSRVADCGVGGVGIISRRLRSSSSRSSSSSSRRTTTVRAASDPPPAVNKATYSAPTEALPNPSDDEDLLQYPDRARWVSFFSPWLLLLLCPRFRDHKAADDEDVEKTGEISPFSLFFLSHTPPLGDDGESSLKKKTKYSTSPSSPPTTSPTGTPPASSPSTNCCPDP